MPGQSEGPDQSSQQMPGFVLAERRHLVDDGGNQIERAAVQIQIEVLEDGLVFEPAQVEGQDLLTVGILDFLVPTDAVMLEGSPYQYQHDGQYEH